MCYLAAEYMPRKGRQGKAVGLPTEVVRMIVRLVDYELFIKGDPVLQRYMIRNDMIMYPKYVFVWAVSAKKLWAARRLQKTYTLQLPPGLQVALPVRALVVREPNVYEHIREGRIEAALERSSGADDFLLKKALQTVIESGKKCPDAWKLVVSWPQLGFSFVYRSVLVGNCGFLRQLARHSPGDWRPHEQHVVRWCLGHGAHQLRTLRCVWRMGARYDPGLWDPEICISDPATFQWCVQKAFKSPQVSGRFGDLVSTALQKCCQCGYDGVLEQGLRYLQPASVEGLCQTAATHGRTGCLRMLIRHAGLAPGSC